MDYETLDKIADSYIPFLAIIFFVGLTGRSIKNTNERQFLLNVFVLFMGLLIASYGIMFLDNAFKFWPSFELDYSAHTAVSLTLALSICALARQYWKLTMGSFIFYLALMLYQKYHTALDIASTMAPIGLSALVLFRFLFLQTKDNKRP